MSDIAGSNTAFPSTAVDRNALVAKRYAAERRFQAYGIAAIVVTAFFVLVLLIDIFSKGLPAFIENRLVLGVTAEQSALDPQNTRDPDKIRAGDFDGLIRDALRAELPGVTSRGDRKLLNSLLSSGAADDMRNTLVANPALIGTKIETTVLLSDDADQYFKGYQTPVSRHQGQSALAISVEDGKFRLSTASPEFGSPLAAIRNYVTSRLARDSVELARLDAAVSDLDRNVKLAEQNLSTATAAADQAAIASATAERDKATADLQAITANRDILKAKVDALKARLGQQAGPQKLDENFPSLMVEADGGMFKVVELADSSVLAEAIVPPGPALSVQAGQWSFLELSTPENDRRLSDREAMWLENLKAKGAVESGFAWRFFTSGDSREPELAGIKGALAGTVLTLAVTLLICLPIGVGAAVYLEEFAPKNRLTDLIEININNLAAVPSIVFGLLGLAMFLNFFGLPRSAPLVGGLVLALLVLPTIIIASRAALKAVPPSIKEAALGVGASHQQAIFHHVLPLAIPGIMTGTIIGMAHALGETAPLLMIGMVAFIVDVPQGLTEAATVMPVQIYLWSDLPEVAFQAKTAAAIVVLLGVLFAMNAFAIIVRKRFERRW
jgi:phosphate transport system permease protein